MTQAPWQDVLDFWFLPVGDPGHGKSRPEWFRKDHAFDASIRERFGALIEQSLDSGLEDWRANLRGTLARIIVLDQFTRNVFRDSPRAFAGDAQALALATAIFDRRDDRQLLPAERWFTYLPFEHAEDIAMQERAVALFTALEAESDLGNLVEYAVRHRDIIAQFGRFPHRNRILGRPSTDEEAEFLKLPGSGF